MKPDDDLRTADGLVVPKIDLQWTFARSGGAGGQHINKTSSKATLIVAVESVTGRDISLTRIRAKLPSEIRVTSQSSRSQWRNRQLCLAQLAEILDTAAKAPSPKRRKSKPTRGSVERRLDNKRRESDKKESRRTDDW